MTAWYQDQIVVPGRQPLFLCLVAFLLTFVVTRLITRMIRSGRGPFKNVSAGGLHVHHVVPGIIAVLIGGLLGFGATLGGFWINVGAVLFGIGAALVLDEFAMILHFSDVYWEEEGRLSADAVLIAVAVMGSALVVAAPSDPPGPADTDPYVAVLMPVLFVVFWVLPTAITILKGKLGTAALSLVILPLCWIGSIRLAKPTSPFAHVRYRNRPEKARRAQQRFERHSARWRPLRTWFQQHIFGFDSTPANKSQASAAEAVSEEAEAVSEETVTAETLGAESVTAKADAVAPPHEPA